jgi:hypothetical protein
LAYNNLPSDVESDCIAEVQAPRNVEEEPIKDALALLFLINVFPTVNQLNARTSHVLKCN